MVTVITIISNSNTFSILECSQHVFLIGREHCVETHFTKYRHIIFIIGRIYTPFRFFSIYFQRKRQWFGNIIFTTSINNLFVCSDIGSFIYSERNFLRSFRVYFSTHRVCTEPVWQTFDSKVLDTTAYVVQRNNEFIFFILHLIDSDFTFSPFQLIAVYIRTPTVNGRIDITIQVTNISQCHIYNRFLQYFRSLFQIDNNSTATRYKAIFHTLFRSL